MSVSQSSATGETRCLAAVRDPYHALSGRGHQPGRGGYAANPIAVKTEREHIDRRRRSVKPGNARELTRDRARQVGPVSVLYGWANRSGPAHLDVLHLLKSSD